VLVEKKADVFVVGGGPAGLAAGIAAARKGFTVTVADGTEPPIDKPCGEGMMPETRAALSELGVELPEGIGWKFRGIRFVQEEWRIEAKFPSGEGIGVPRPVLHQRLIEEAEKCGVTCLWKTPVRGIEGGKVSVNGGAVRARWIIGADGGASRVRKWVDLDDSTGRTQRMAARRRYRVRPWCEYVEVYWTKNTQVYVTPIGREEVCIVTMGDSAEDVKFERVLQDLPSLRTRISNAEVAGRERGVVTAMHRLRRVTRGNVALVGDASGGVDAITGEGLRLAFRQAGALAEAISKGDLREYQEVHRQLQKRPLWMGKLMLELGRREKVRERVLRTMNEHEGLFAKALAIHVGRATPRDTIATMAEFGWRLLAA